MLPAATTATAVYNADNQLTSWNGTAISYDLNGNLTNDGTRAFTWDARNRMTGITSVAGYVYDGVGRRQSVTTGRLTVTALYDGFDSVQEQAPAGTVSANLQIGLGVDERFTRTKAGATSTYLTDLLGSTVALADSAGVVQTSYGYDPYGVTSQTGAANDNPYQFTGRQNDGTGLYYYRARYYNPAWGRFVSEDPIGLISGINLYAYAGDAPTQYSDPYGEQAWLEIIGGRLPPVVEAFIRQGAKIPEEALNLPRETIPNQTGKAAASDVPSWCQGARPMIRETGTDFAKRLMNEKYGEGKWGSSRQQKGEFSKIKKWGDRNFRIPDDWLKTYKPPAI